MTSTAAAHSSSAESAERPALSIVVIGRNEGQRLARCLDSIQSMQSVGGRVEVIYVDSASTDDSVQLATAAGAVVIALDAERPTAAMGRNAGWRRAGAEWVLFLDGDTILDSGFARKALHAIEADESLAVVWGHRREIHPETSIYNGILDLDWMYPPGIVLLCGGDVLMRRRALEEAGGYDQELIAGEEPELCRRLRARGYRILHIDEPMTGHDLQMTRFGQYWKRSTRTGHAYAEIAIRFRGTQDPLWQRERRANFIRGGFWVLSFAAAAAVLGLGWLPLLGWLLLLLALSLRSAWKVRWKAPGRAGLLFLYGLHSHLQQVPILVGQLQFEWNRFRGRRRSLIEYKESS